MIVVITGIPFFSAIAVTSYPSSLNMHYICGFDSWWSSENDSKQHKNVVSPLLRLPWAFVAPPQPVPNGIPGHSRACGLSPAPGLLLLHAWRKPFWLSCHGQWLASAQDELFQGFQPLLLVWKHWEGKASFIRNTLNSFKCLRKKPAWDCLNIYIYKYIGWTLCCNVIFLFLPYLS